MKQQLLYGKENDYQINFYLMIITLQLSTSSQICNAVSSVPQPALDKIYFISLSFCFSPLSLCITFSKYSLFWMHLLIFLPTPDFTFSTVPFQFGVPVPSQGYFHGSNPPQSTNQSNWIAVILCFSSIFG